MMAAPVIAGQVRSPAPGHHQAAPQKVAHRCVSQLWELEAAEQGPSRIGFDEGFHTDSLMASHSAQGLRC